MSQETEREWDKGKGSESGDRGEWDRRKGSESGNRGDRTEYVRKLERADWRRKDSK